MKLQHPQLLLNASIATPANTRRAVLSPSGKSEPHSVRPTPWLPPKHDLGRPLVTSNSPEPVHRRSRRLLTMDNPVSSQTPSTTAPYLMAMGAVIFHRPGQEPNFPQPPPAPPPEPAQSAPAQPTPAPPATPRPIFDPQQGSRYYTPRTGLTPPGRPKFGYQAPPVFGHEFQNQ